MRSTSVVLFHTLKKMEGKRSFKPVDGSSAAVPDYIQVSRPTNISGQRAACSLMLPEEISSQRLHH